MSLLPETGLEEYARQCTLQRRRYEDCVQQAQQRNPFGETVRTGAIAQATEGTEFVTNRLLDRCDEQNQQSCLVDLLEICVEPLGWNDEGSVLGETRGAAAEARQWQSNRSQRPYQRVTNATGKSMSSVSYGAP